MQESPLGADLTDPIFNDFFNLTFTYRTNADISRPYGAFVHKGTSKLATPEDWNARYDQVKSKTMTQVKNKTENVAWIVSHCETDSKREEYVKILQNYTQVDIYGDCGTLKVPEKDHYSDVDAGYLKIAEKYKFYLSLENSQCINYVTEKFFNALKFGLIPIANGALNRKEYEKMAPPNSYLHIDDFASPQDLANYIKQIANNPKLFQSFFWWQEFYQIQTDFVFETNCQLCDKINEEIHSPNDYSNFKEYWHQCRRPKI